MKRLLGLLMPAVLVVALLCGCAEKASEQTRQTTLANSGVTLTVSGREVSESTATWFSRDSSVSREVCLFTAPDITTIDFGNISADAVTVDFVWPIPGGYMEYDLGDPIEKVDYCPLDTEEGTLRYRFDTAYSFCITITTEQGTDWVLLDCCREV